MEAWPSPEISDIKCDLRPVNSVQCNAIRMNQSLSGKFRKITKTQIT